MNIGDSLYQQVVCGRNAIRHGHTHSIAGTLLHACTVDFADMKPFCICNALLK